jgi:hypothetical protein
MGQSDSVANKRIRTEEKTAAVALVRLGDLKGGPATVRKGTGSVSNIDYLTNAVWGKGSDPVRRPLGTDRVPALRP